MRKDQLQRRSKDTEAPNEVSDHENGDPLSGSADPFDALLTTKSDETTTTRSNGKRATSPVPDDSDAENDNEKGDETKNDDEQSETNTNSAKKAKKDDDEEAGYEVEAVVDHKFNGKKKYFKIRWKNYDESEDTWELEKNLSCPELIERYLADHPDTGVTVKEKKEKKVRISLPAQTPTRSTPKRTAAERKTVVDDPLTDSEEPDKKKSKRGRPKKTIAKDSKATKKQDEYEVLKIVDDEIRNGKKYYRIRWKGWAAKDDTWEPKSSLSCPEIIKAYEDSKTDNEEYEVEKIVGEKIENGARYFLVKWKGWPESDNSWETDKSVDCYELIEKFRDSCRAAGKSPKRAANATPKTAKAKKARKTQNDEDDDDDDDDAEADTNDSDDADKDGDGDVEKEWEVEKIINVRKGPGGRKEYLIRWKGCKASDDSWEPEKGVNSPGLIAAFLKKNKK